MTIRKLVASAAALLSVSLLSGCLTSPNCPIGGGCYEVNGVIKSTSGGVIRGPQKKDAVNCSVQFSVLSNNTDSSVTVTPWRVFGNVDDTWPRSSVPVKPGQTIGLDNFWPTQYRDVKTQQDSRIYLVIKSKDQSTEYPPNKGFGASEFVCTDNGITLPPLEINESRNGQLFVRQARVGRFR